MIIVQTPLRISFLGGGTDFEDFYLKYGGAVLTTAIDKCVFVIVKERFDDLIYINYSQKEIVENIQQIKHSLVREAMKLSGVSSGIEITTLADIPTEGSGMGSSSSVTVGLLNAFYTYRGEIVNAESLADKACQVEIDTLKAPIGKQDQYIAAYGGLRFISFGRDGIKVEKIKLPVSKQKLLSEHFLLFYTGIIRKANDILTEQKSNIENRIDVLSKMRDLAFEGKNAIIEGDFDTFGAIMHRGWLLKKQMASKVSNSQIDDLFEKALKAGAIGGKILGAGGGGFLLLYCPKGKKDNVRAALHGLRELPFQFESDGSKVIFNYRRN
jgi:D-glycero-alpha-D-manno-heptose-7-phosphate kinase